MRKLILVALVLMLVMIPSVKASGTIRIGPDFWPIMVGSPADFQIWVEGAGNPTSSPNILLAMTAASWNGLTGNVVVGWSGGSMSILKSEFMAVAENSEKVPTSGVTPGGGYTVASLKDHLSLGLSEPISSTDTIYWVMKPFLSGPLTHSPQSFTITLPSTNPRMLVYAIGKTEGSELFDNKVPPTRPGFVVPELGPVLLTLASFSALAIFVIRRRKA